MMTGMRERGEPLDRLAERLAGADTALLQRFREVSEFGRHIRTTEYHLTNACNIRCRGCWFFEYDFDKRNKEEKDLARLGEFVDRERDRRINTALLIGGEPTLFVDRIAVFVSKMKHVTISTNGLRQLPRDGFEKVAIFSTLFGGGKLDDDLRGVKPNGSTFTGLFESALDNYRGDDRVTFIYAITGRGIPYIEETVARIADNGNKVNFNFYSEYGSDDPLRNDEEKRLLEEGLRVREAHPDTVLAHPYYLQAIATGQTPYGKFGYDVCPSVSWDHPDHAARLRSGKPTLPLFNAYSADLKTINFCCTSGHCSGCRDSQAVSSWLLVSVRDFMVSRASLQTWVELAERYWGQFVWSPYRKPSSVSPHPASRRRGLPLHADSAGPAGCGN